MWMRNVATPVALAGIGMTFYAILQRHQKEGNPDYVSYLRYILSSEPQELNTQDDQERWENSILSLSNPVRLFRARCEPAARDIVPIKSDEDIQGSNSSQVVQEPKPIISKTALLARVSSLITKIQKLSKESKEPESRLALVPVTKRLSTSETYLKSSLQLIIRREGTYSGLNSMIIFGFPVHCSGPHRQLGGFRSLETSSLTCLPEDNFPFADNAVRLTRSLATAGIPAIEFCTRVKTENASRQSPHTLKVPGSSKSLTFLDSGREKNLPRLVHRCATYPCLLPQVEHLDAPLQTECEFFDPLEWDDTCPCGFSCYQEGEQGDSCRMSQSCTKLQRSQADLVLQNVPAGDADVDDESCTAAGDLSKSSSDITVIDCETQKEFNYDSFSDNVQASVKPLECTAKTSKWRDEQHYSEFLKLNFSPKLALNASCGTDLIKRVASLYRRHQKSPLKFLNNAAFRIKIQQLKPKSCLATTYCDSKIILFLFFLYALFGIFTLRQEIASNVLAVISFPQSEIRLEQASTSLEGWAFSK